MTRSFVIHLQSTPNLKITSCATWGNSLATTCADGSVSLWSLPLALLASFSTPAKVRWGGCHGNPSPVSQPSPSVQMPTCVDVSPRSLPSQVRCTVGYSDGCLRTFDSRHMSRRGKMQPHNRSVTSVRYSTDGESPHSCNCNSTCGSLLLSISALPYPGTRVLSGCAGGVVAVSSTTSGVCLAMVSDHKGSPVTGIVASQHTLHVRYARTHTRTYCGSAQWLSSCAVALVWTPASANMDGVKPRWPPQYLGVSMAREYPCLG